MPTPDLRKRKQERAREEIVAAAFALFAERGYTEVTVADIAERAEVGRTTFFRYFGDKQEVVFNEQQWLDDVARRHSALRLDKPPSLVEAIALLRETTAMICRETTRDADHYIRRERLIADNPELDDRAARKYRRLAAMLSKILLEQGASAQTAALAPQIALACYNAGREVAAGDPAALESSVDRAFEQLIASSSTCGGD